MCTEKVKIKLFVTYCSQVYCGHSSDKSYRKVNVAYNNVFRSFLWLPRDVQGRSCSASGMFISRKVKSFQEIIRNMVYKFQCRLNVSANELVSCTLFNDIKNRSKLRKHWNRILFHDRGDEG